MDNLRLILLILGVALVAGIYLWETRWRRRKSLDDLDDLDTSYLDGLGDTRSRKDYEYARDHGGFEDDDLDDGGEFDEDFEDSFDEDLEDDLDDEEATEEEDMSLAVFGGEDDSMLDGLEFIVPGSGGNGSMSPPVQVASDGLLVALTVMAGPKNRFAGVAISQLMDELGFTFGQMQIFHKLADPDAFSSVPLYSVANVLKPGTFDLSSIAEFSTPGIALFMQVTGRAGSVEAFDAMLAAGAQIADRLGGELRDESRSTLTNQAVSHLREQIVEFGRQLRVKSTE